MDKKIDLLIEYVENIERAAKHTSQVLKEIKEKKTQKTQKTVKGLSGREWDVEKLEKELGKELLDSFIECIDNDVKMSKRRELKYGKGKTIKWQWFK